MGQFSNRAGTLLIALISLTFLLIHSSVFASDPTRDWKTITTPHFNIHFYRSSRQDEEAVAQRFAQIAERAHEIVTPFLRHTPNSRTDVVITDDTDFANGSAQIVPMNIVRIYLTGPESNSTLNDHGDWLFGLIVHEYTHIVHIDTIHGIARFINAVLGKTWAPNQIQPRWFNEGLAVFQESARTSGGRLRSSVFDMYMRMAILEGKFLNIDQISSATRYFPRGTVPYLYGAYFIKYIADRFGEDKLTQISHRYGGSLVPYGLNRVAQEVLGRSYVDLYKDFKAHLEKKYFLEKAAAESKGLTAFERVTDHGEGCSSPRFSRDGRDLLFIDSDGHSHNVIKVLDARSRKEKARYLKVGGGGVDFSADGKSIVYAESTQWQTFNSFYDLFVLKRSTGQVRRLTRGLRAQDPSVSPDGNTVAFVTNELGAMSLAVMPFDGGEPQMLFRGKLGDQVFTPRWSPDGKTLVYSRFKAGGFRDIYVMDIKTRKSRAILTDRAMDMDPVFSPDGKKIYFSSDRTGIYNVFSFDLDKQELKQISNVLGGAFEPAVTADEKEIFYVGYSYKGYDLHVMQTGVGQIATPYVDDRPPSSVPKETVKKYPVASYNPLKTLYPRAWSFRFGSDSFGNAVGVDLMGSDVVLNHAFGLATTVSTSKGYVSYSLAYRYSRFWPSITLNSSHFKIPRSGVVLDGEKSNYIEDNYGFSVGTSLPVLRIPEHSGSISLNYQLNWFRNADTPLPLVEPDMLSPRLPSVGLLAGLSLGLNYSHVERYAHSISSEKGRAININLRIDHPGFGSDYKSTQVIYGWTEFIPMPWFEDHVLALRLGGGVASGNLNRRGIFYLGGFPEQDLLRSFFESTRMGGAFLRGYPPGTVNGDQFHLLNVEYRMPLLNIERGFSSLPLYFTHVHMAAFTDVGNAFFDDLKLEDFKVGVGAELFFESIIGYYLPTTFRIGYARGLMEGGGNQFHFILGNTF